jgi:predicted phage terminase large subunit-like protein
MFGRGVRPARGMVTPADFAMHASGGRWECARHLDLLNRKLVDLAARRITRLVVSMPPRHGKSFFISQYFPAWWLGTFPDDPVILASYEADFAATWGRRVQEVVKAHGRSVFGIDLDPRTTAAARWELAGRSGSMTTAGVGGPITGRGAKLLVIDDALKNAEEAASEVTREATWDWFTSTAYTRLEPGGVVAIVMTRWHEDDLVGRLLRQAQAGGEPWEVLNLPALAEEDDPLGRAEGEALWPERYDAAALHNIKSAIGGYYFDSLYQGRPRPKEGGVFKYAWFAGKATTVLPDPAGATYCRYWDRAATEKKGDYSAGVLMARSKDGRYHVLDVRHGRWSSLERDRVILETAHADRRSYGHVRQRGEQEPGSGGKDAALAFVRLLDGFDVKCAPVTGDKESRARPFASQCEAGMVELVRGAYDLDGYVQELCSFPRGRFDDRVDASSGAHNNLSGDFDATWAPSPVRGYRGRVA